MSLLCTAGLGFAAGNVGTAGGRAGGAAAVPGGPSGHSTGSPGTPAATPASAPPSAAVSSPAPARPNAAATALNDQRGSTNDVRDSNHRSHDRDRSQQFEYTYGYPWWGYGDGWGWGGYSSGFLTDDNYNSSSTASGSSNTASSTPPSEPTANAPSSAAQAAVAQNEVNHSPEVVTANDAVQAAQTAYDAEQRRVISALANDPKYQQALARERGAAGHLQQVKSSASATQPGTVSSATIAAATVKMNQASEVTTMQQQAMNADPAASAAKARLDRAVSDRDALMAKLTARK